MARKVIWSAEAIFDLGEVVRHIAADNRTVAEKVGRKILEQTRMLADFPLAGRIVPEERNPAVREIILPPYRVIHELNANTPRVDILRVWHGARGKPEI